MSLSIVAAPPGAASSSAIDIVAVHGLGGDAINTWTDPKSEAFWLRDFLPQQIPDARIMTFGYNADAAFGQSTAEIIDHAKSLLASLVDKREEPEALFQARLESRYQVIKDATLGLIFMGTPHRGSDKATYGKVLSNVAQFLSHRPPQRLLSALQTNSDVLLRLTTDFRFQLPDYEIVEKHSALLETNHEEQIPVDADHSAMCKFETDQDVTFERVYKRIKRMKNQPRHIANERLVSYNTHFEVPHLLSPVFTGRDNDLQHLTTSLATGLSSLRQHQRRYVIFGLGGSGKTQICLKYVQAQRERYWGIFWVDASTEESIQQSFMQLALLLQVEENVNSVKRRLAHVSEAWLLVLDNADDPRLQLTSYLPAGNRGDVIITSRNPQCQHYSTVIYGTTTPSPDLGEESKVIVDVLGRLALAIVQAGAYIRETSCSFHDYLDIYERRKGKLLRYLPQHLGTDYQHSVYTTWQVSVDAIESYQDAVSRHTLSLLSLLGFYHHDQIPLQMFYNAWQPQPIQAVNYLPWDDTISDLFDYRQAVQASISLLASFSLITRNTDTSMSLHPLVHAWCRGRTCEDEEGPLNYRRALTLLSTSVNWEFASEDYTFRRSLVSHVHELLRLRDLPADWSHKEKVEQWANLALILAENGWTTDALPLTEEVVALQKSKLGADHPDTLRSMNNLANQYSEAGRRDEALKLTEEVLNLRKSKLGADHPDTLTSVHNLAIRYSEAGRRDEALKLTEEVVALHTSKLGMDHPDTLTSVHNLAIRYSDAGRRDEALSLTEAVVALHKIKLGADHPDTLRSMHNLAIWYSEAGRRDEALSLTEEVVALHKSKLGADRPDKLESERLLAHLAQVPEEPTLVNDTQRYQIGPDSSCHDGFVQQEVNFRSTQISRVFVLADSDKILTTNSLTRSHNQAR
ncbi:hypothetical protein LTR47_011671 [Exophiala xenobiotica]|nr:hypothetical protein LTR41_011560 [Exophiala xenobiotica]KAK5214833.1 hypothetical protein LTR72_012057 [Exophiala xenobiotica]KAK5218827.1 hypothetical protein LTR47_011671 [Exophiala xenobiotica]KAK5243270.1 hypothetical protein LTS06_010926 [Exophiala xenobiotica]KAK5282712.1 hypothetical protein LTR14_011985 [Exophiala xenobiotica]